MYGIPEYRLPKAIVRAEVKKIEALGVTFKPHCMVGRNNVTIDSIFADGIDTDEKGYVITSNYPMGMTTRRGVFAGGDVVHRPQTVVLAMKAAKEVAQGIAQYVDAVRLLRHIDNK